MHELSKEVAAKLARCTLRSGAPEDEILSRCRELGLAIEPIGHYYDKVSAPASKRQAPSEAKAQVKTSKVAKQVVDLSQIKHRSYPATGDAAKTQVTTLSSTSSECKNPISQLKEMCEKSGCQKPLYEIVEAPSGTVTKRWKCTVSVTGLGPGTISISETALQKQQAKTLATQRLLERLNNTGGPQNTPQSPVVSQQTKKFPARSLSPEKNCMVVVKADPVLSDSVTILQPASSLVTATKSVEVKKKKKKGVAPSSSPVPVPTITDLRTRNVTKSPTQLLYEYCRKCGVREPVFGDALKNEVTGEFTTMVIVEKCTGTGAGKKKAESKENASLDALIKLKSNSTELESMLKDFGIL